MSGSYAYVPRAPYTQLAGAKVDQKDPVLQLSRTYALITDYGFWSQWCRQRVVAIIVVPLPIVTKPSPYSWSDFPEI